MESATAAFMRSRRCTSLAGSEVRIPPLPCCSHLVQDLASPLRLYQACCRNPDKQVTLHIRVQGVGIVDNDKGHVSVLANFLANGGHLVHGCPPALVIPSLVLEQVSEGNPPVG